MSTKALVTEVNLVARLGRPVLGTKKILLSKPFTKILSLKETATIFQQKLPIIMDGSSYTEGEGAQDAHKVNTNGCDWNE